MKRSARILTLVTLQVPLIFSGRGAFAQGFGSPLEIQGLDRTTMHSATSRGAGGITIGLRNDVSMMFSNPASLLTLHGMQVSLGSRSYSSDARQTQQYGPAKYYPNFSLVMEGLTGLVPDPQLDTAGTYTAKDSVQRPFDDIGPNWTRRSSKTLPLELALGMPFTVAGVRVAAALGAVEYANVNWFFQNNNVLSPEVNVQRPVPVPLVKNDSLSLPVEWYQYVQSREGLLYGYGGAISIELSPEIALGVSGLLLRGTADDYEQTTGRGHLVFYSSYFRLDSVDYGSTASGTSDFKGEEYTLSGVYRGRYVSVGFAVKPPSTITRTYSATLRHDTSGVASTAVVSGEDRTKLPWRGTVGLSLTLRENLIFGLEYEMRPYASAVHTRADGSESNPWLSASLFRVGAEYAPLSWLSLRVGVRQQAEVFQPEGNPLVGEPVGYTIYSAGCGVRFAGVTLNLAYEYSDATYTDLFQNNANLNGDARHEFVFTLSYDMPWLQGE